MLALSVRTPQQAVEVYQTTGRVDIWSMEKLWDAFAVI